MLKADPKKLRAARELIARPGTWTQGYYARNARGQNVQVTSKNAVCWCLVGAVERVGGGDLEIEMLALAIDDSPPDWQDEPCRTHAEVLDVLDKTIALAEAA